MEESMKGIWYRWIICAIMLICIALLVVSPSLAEVRPLDTDMKTHGYPARKDGWLSKDEYQDESIHVVVNAKQRKPKSSAGKVTCRWVIIEIADPSQLRTTMSNENYTDPTLVRATPMAKSVQAVVAMNGDFMKYKYNTGYVVRQGVFYRDALDGSMDALIIDQMGDFHDVPSATSEAMVKTLSGLESVGRFPMNVFTFGPVLVRDGQIPGDMANRQHSGGMATQRIALLQLDTLKYAIVEIDGGNSNGMNLNELAKYILELFPDCKLAYNFDGGGSTHLILNGKMIHETPNSRPISDIIYFASAQLPEE